jgi:hypothetical protein
MQQIENTPFQNFDCRSESDECLVTNLCLRIRLNKMWQKIFIDISVADPGHFGVDPDPRIHASD